MKVLLIGECYSGNVGDQIVASITKELLGKLYPSSSIYLVDISGREELNTAHEDQTLTLSQRLRMLLLKYIPVLDVVRKLISNNKRRIRYRAIINSDNYNLAVFCGGQVINSTFTEPMDTLAKLLHQANIPTIYSSVGLGIVKEKDIQIFKRVLEYPNVRAISCRCEEKRFNSFFGFENGRVQGTFDPGICASDFWGISRKNKTSLVGLGIMCSSRISNKRMILFWKQIISYLDEMGIPWRLFYTGTWKDYLLAKEVLFSLNITNPECKIKEDIYTPLDLINELSQFSKIISFRLHSHIISYSMGIPTIAIRWDKKIDDFFAKIGYSDRVFDIDAEVTKIIDKLKECDYISSISIQKAMKLYSELFAKQCVDALETKGVV
ncbi:MAG: polysaccharide pyruvyl transferase family protein [Bacteroidaceae bacterium]|nr:polysaccharide pyruvyl transferase family protein [Bacteroidaceae bacterium]